MARQTSWPWWAPQQKAPGPATVVPSPGSAGPGDDPPGTPRWPQAPFLRHGAWALVVMPGLVAVLPGRAEGVAAGEGGNRVEVVGLRGVDHGDRVDAGAGADRGGLAVGGHRTAGDLEGVVVGLRHDADRERRPLGDPLGAGVHAGGQRAG